MSTEVLQLDLFGHVEAARQAVEAERARTAERDVAFDELVRTAKVDAAGAEAAGIYNMVGETTVWICPACGEWEPNEMLLAQNHGIQREYLVRWDDGEWANDGAYYGRLWCVALDLTANHATYGEGFLHPRQRIMLARICPEVRQHYEQEVSTRRHRGR